MALTGEQSRRGQPLLFLGLLFAGWILLRVVAWESPWPMATGARPVERLVHQKDVEQALPPAAIAADLSAESSIRGGGELEQGRVLPRPLQPVSPLPIQTPTFAKPADSPPFAGNRRAIGHNLLWMAAMAELPMPTAVAAWIDAKSGSPQAAPSRPAELPRWRVDGWVVLREGSSNLSAASDGPATYGASQAGAVVSFRLAPHSKRDPAAYVRATRALVAKGESEIAAGLRVRPVANLPVNGHFEVRMVDGPGGTSVRPAAFVSGALPPVALPLHMEAEGYAQAGYVGGGFATAFADGRVTLTRKFAEPARVDLAAGAGVWGGAQRDAARFDIGPTVKLKLKLGPAVTHVSADYRLRVAGQAEPRSGAALTITSGF